MIFYQSTIPQTCPSNERHENDFSLITTGLINFHPGLNHTVSLLKNFPSLVKSSTLTNFWLYFS